MRSQIITNKSKINVDGDTCTHNYIREHYAHENFFLSVIEATFPLRMVLLFHNILALKNTCKRIQSRKCTVKH